MITLTTAQDALKTLYLGVVAEQLNLKSDPLLAKIEQTSQDVWGKEIIKLVPYGVSGGVSSGTETGALPKASHNGYLKFKSTLKNLYGTIEISDKAIRASENTAGAFVNLLTAEMEGLIKASKANLSRMVYGDGTGFLANVGPDFARLGEGYVEVDNMKPFFPGLVVDVYEGSTLLGTSRITATEIEGGYYIKLDTNLAEVAPEGALVYVQGSRDNEIKGLKYITDEYNYNLYGIDTNYYPQLKPITTTSSAITLSKIQQMLDEVEERNNASINYITTSYGVRRKYLQLLDTNRRNVDYMELDGGFKSLCYNGIPLVASKYVDNGYMYFLNTDDFKMHQLCDWRWLESENGKILQQKPGLPIYTATLVKYADIICDRPGCICLLKGINEA